MERKIIARPALMHIVRLGFVLLSMFMGASISSGYDRAWWTGSLLGLLFAAIVVLIELGLRDLSFRRFSHATIGLLVGMTGAWIITRIGFFETPGLITRPEARSIFELIVYLALGFLGMMLALRTNREEFSLLIPYVRFRQEANREQPIVLDTNILIDGRLPRVIATGFLNGSLQVPRFVIDELHHLADSKDDVRSERGQRGLECLEHMRVSSKIEVTIQEDFTPTEQAVDAKLMTLAKSLDARLLTHDGNLIKAARVQGIPTLSLQDLTRALRPLLTPGDELSLPLVKEGKDSGQAVGFLADGSMIVVNEAAEKIGSTQDVIVAGTVKTSAGRLVFAELKGSPRAKPYLAS